MIVQTHLASTCICYVLMCVLEIRTTLAYEIINMVLSFSSTVHDFHSLEFCLFWLAGSFGWQIR